MVKGDRKRLERANIICLFVEILFDGFRARETLGDKYERAVV